MSFPDKFPYGDGVFGLARLRPLTFQQCVTMHLLREELVYQLTPDGMEAAALWFRGGSSAVHVQGASTSSPPGLRHMRC